MVRNSIFFIVLLIAISCSENKVLRETQALDTITNIQQPDEINKNIQFSISDCKKEGKNDTGRVIINTQSNDTIKLEIGNWMSCAWNQGFLDSVVLNKDTLNVIIDRPFEKIIIDENGLEQKLYEETDCNCYFLIDLVLIGFGNKPKTILINSKSIKKQR